MERSTVNRKRKYHRLPAILGAALSSAAVLLAVYAGTSCEFLSVSVVDPVSEEELFLIAPVSAEGFQQTSLQQTSIGVMCTTSTSDSSSSFYDRDGDDMWNLSRVFWILGLTLGSCTAALAWACIFVKPSLRIWKFISILSALAAVLQVPVFILFESEPCSSFRDTQSCQMGQGGFLLISSTILFIAVCICTQCLDPPDEKLELCDTTADVLKRNKSSDDDPDYYYNTSYRDNPHERKASYYDYDEEADNDRVNLWVRHGAAESVDDDEVDAVNNENLYITRILPAGKEENEKESLKKPRGQPKKSNGIFASLFSSKKSKDRDIELEVPQVETKPTSEEEEEDNDNFEGLHHQLDDSQVILKILPEQKAPPAVELHNRSLLDDATLDTAEQEDFLLQRRQEMGIGKEVELDLDDSQSDIALADEAEAQEWASQALFSTKHAVEDVLEEEEEEEESAADNVETSIEKPPSPEPTVQTEPTIEKELPENDSPLTSNAILKDLKVVEAVASSNKQHPDPVFSTAVSSNEGDDNGVNNKPPCTSSDKLLFGVRSLTQRLKRDTKTKSSKKRQSKRKSRRAVMGVARGYATLDDEEYDAEYDSDEGAATLDTPPLELKLPVKEHDSGTDTADLNDVANTSGDSNGVFADSGIQFQMPDFSDDDEDDIFMENNSWNDMAVAATSAGIRQAANDLDSDENPFITENSLGSYHSDPEPVLHESGNEEAGAALHESFGDGSTLSDEEEHHSDPGQISRGRGSSRRNGGRRRAASPVESIKSHRSLLYTTIHEETVEEVKEELETAYSLTRTISAPESSRTVTRMASVKLSRTLGSDTASFDPRRISALEKKLNTEVDEGDIPMLPRRKAESVSATSTNDTSKAMIDAVRGPMDEVDDEESELDIQPVVPTTQPPTTSSEGAVNQSLSTEVSSRSTHTWKEPELPTRKMWKEGAIERNADTTAHSTPTKSWKDPSLLSDQKWRDVLESRATNISDTTSDTDVSRTTDSFSEDSTSENVDGHHRGILRSRSFGGDGIKTRKSSYSIASRSLSPSRARSIRKLMSMPDGSATARRARDIRIRRLQKLKGYSPLDDEPGTPTRRTRNASPEDLTPKRKTFSDSLDEKKEDDAMYGGEPLTEDSMVPLPKDLMQPNLGAFPTSADLSAIPQEDDDSEYVEEPEQTSTEFDSMLSDLDLQLIDLRRPVGAEYGDDEGSL
ncbi:MAG: hypothetical protein SGILL_002261 [Bacillariaceae sp.]